LAESLRRRGDRPADRIEAGGEAFLQRVGEGFAQLARQRSWLRLDAARSPDQVQAECRQLLGERLGGGRR
jgi:dTMP kinase